MNLFLHNLKVATRNLMKYKLQTLISIVSIAIGIVTLAFAHSIITNMRLPLLYGQPYGERAFNVGFTSIWETDQKYPRITNELIRAVKRDGGLKNAEKIAVPNGLLKGYPVEFHLPDSTVKKGLVDSKLSDPEYPAFIGFRSAITGREIPPLKKGEAIISEYQAKKLFGDINPVGTQIRYLPVPITIVDVFRPLAMYDQKYFPVGNNEIYFCTVDHLEDTYLSDDDFYASFISMALREGSSEQQLIDEINQRVSPLGYEASLKEIFDHSEITTISTIKVIIYLIGSLILLAGVIGFLRVELQLFRLRRREIALRIVNGASLASLFSLLFMEIAITIIISILLAALLGYELQAFVDSHLQLVIENTLMIIDNLWQYCLIVGGSLLLICSAIAWIALLRTVKLQKKLAANMRSGRNHIFRNIMLGIQLTISIIFVGCTFILLQGQKEVGRLHNIPENDSEYKDYVLLRLWTTDHKQELIDAIRQLPEVAQMVPSDLRYTPLREVKDNPEIVDKLNHAIYFPTYFAKDTVTPQTLGMDIEWFNRDFDRNSSLLLSENTYKQLGELGLLNKSTLTLDIEVDGQHGLTLPIGGIIKSIPYDLQGEALLAIYPGLSDGAEYLIVPKPGRGKELLRAVNKVIAYIAPEEINQKVFNYRTRSAPFYVMVEAIGVGASILGIVSLIICAMTIFSAVALDTRSRRKEVAIRKVNGAKRQDIFRLFGRVYLVIIAIALVIAVPVCLLFNKLVCEMVGKANREEVVVSMSPVGPIMLGIGIVVLLVLLIVGWQIRSVMKVDPAKVIAKE